MKAMRYDAVDSGCLARRESSRAVLFLRRGRSIMCDVLGRNFRNVIFDIPVVVQKTAGGSHASGGAESGKTPLSAWARGCLCSDSTG